MKPITHDKIVRVYSGRPGCMCGCLGSYRYPNGTNVAEMDKRRGYAGTKINNAQCKKVTRIVNEAIAEGPCVESEDSNVINAASRTTVVRHSVGHGEFCTAVDIDGRRYVIYHRPI